MREKRQNKFYFLLQDKRVRHVLIAVFFFSFVVFLLLFLLNAFPLFDSSRYLFLYEIKTLLVQKAWIVLLFLLVWGTIVIRFSWLVAIRQITAPFKRFKKHMQDIALTFNNMIDQIFEELDQKDFEIKEFKKQLDDKKRKTC